MSQGHPPEIADSFADESKSFQTVLNLVLFLFKFGLIVIMQKDL